jgi:hypothetical protein
MKHAATPVRRLKRAFGVLIGPEVFAGLARFSFACTSYACAVTCGAKVARPDEPVTIEYFCPCCALTRREPKEDGTYYVHKACSFCEGSGRV